MRHIWFGAIVQNEKMMEYFNDEMTGWEEDDEMMMSMMENFFHMGQLPNFNQLISEEKSKYAYDLLFSTIDKKDFCMELIKQKLQNWDAERVAIIDLILLCMGITELMFFETIPTKVTINEFIEISKMYSTRQSGSFINGVLDNIYKDLERENKIIKTTHSAKKTQHEA
jgi:N utilization substance protein B